MKEKYSFIRKPEHVVMPYDLLFHQDRTLWREYGMNEVRRIVLHFSKDGFYEEKRKEFFYSFEDLNE